LCMLFDRDSEKHSIMRCPSLDKDAYLTWKHSLKYFDKLHSKVCFHCHIPQCDDMLHPTFAIGASSCDNQDVLAPIGFGIFQHSGLKHRAESRFKVRWTGLDSFAAWLNAAPVSEEEKTNLASLFLWYSSTI
jgi:hypothetical protein